MSGALCTKYHLCVRPLRSAAIIQAYGTRKFVYLLVASNWTSFRRSWDRLQPFSLISNSAYCFAVARSGCSNPNLCIRRLSQNIETASHFLSTRHFPKKLGRVFSFLSIRHLSQKIERFFCFPSIRPFLRKQGRSSRFLLNLSTHRR